MLADPQRAPAGYRTIPAQDVGGRLGENAPAVGQPRDAQAITESVALMAGRDSQRNDAPHLVPSRAILRTPIFQLTFSKLTLPKSTPSNTI